MPFFQLPYPVVDLAKVPGFRYSGGKHYLRKYIARWVPLSGEAYGEPFAGRGNMLFLVKKIAKYNSWWLNDLRTIPFFRAVEYYNGSPLSWPTEEEFRSGVKADYYRHLLIYEPALFWNGDCHTKHNGKKVTYTGNRFYTLKGYRRTLLAMQKVLSECQLSETDACRFIHDFSRMYPDGFLYVDPPYLHANVDSYSEGMVDRKALIRELKDDRCKWLLSEYECDDLVKAFGPPIARIRVPVKSRMGGHKGKKIERAWECLWANYDAKPIPIDYGQGEPPHGKSIDFVENTRKYLFCRKYIGQGSITFKDFKSLWPFWSREELKAEWQRLIQFPYCYYNGKTIIWVGD